MFHYRRANQAALKKIAQVQAFIYPFILFFTYFFDLVNLKFYNKSCFMNQWNNVSYSKDVSVWIK